MEKTQMSERLNLIRAPPRTLCLLLIYPGSIGIDPFGGVESNRFYIFM